MGADLEADNPQALILLPCGRFPGNPFPVARDGAVKPVGIDTSQEQLKISTGEPTSSYLFPRKEMNNLSIWKWSLLLVTQVYPIGKLQGENVY